MCDLYRDVSLNSTVANTADVSVYTYQECFSRTMYILISIYTYIPEQRENKIKISQNPYYQFLYITIAIIAHGYTTHSDQHAHREVLKCKLQQPPAYTPYGRCNIHRWMSTFHTTHQHHSFTSPQITRYQA